LEGIFFAVRRSQRRSDSTPRDDSLPAANADCRRGGNKGTAKLSVRRSYRSSRSSKLSPHPLHDEPGELKNLTVGSNMEQAFGSEEEGKKRKQQGQDRWAEREHLEKKISPRVNRNLRLLWTILASFAVTAPCSKYFPDFFNHGLVISDLHQILGDSFGNDSFGFEEVLGILHNCSL
jgi:hypothetical protein